MIFCLKKIVSLPFKMNKRGPFFNFRQVPLFMMLFVFLSVSSQSQTKTKERSALENSRLDVLLQNLTTQNLKENERNYKANVLLNHQNAILNSIDVQIQKANFILKEGIDYKGYSKELGLIVKWKDNVIKGITSDKKQMQTVRDLTCTNILFNELLTRTESQLAKINQKQESLSSIQRSIDSLASNKVLYQFPTDQEAKKNYYQRMLFLTKDLNLCNKELKNALDSIQKLQVQGNIFKYGLELDLADITNKRNKSNDLLVSWNSDVKEYAKNNKVTREYNLNYSFHKAFLLLFFYVFNQIGLLVSLLFFTLLLTIYLYVIREKYKKANLHENLKFPRYVLNYPFAASVLIIATIFQFILPLPPFVFTALIWTISGCTLTFILYKSVSKKAFLIWLTVFLLNIIAFQGNLLLLYTPEEGMLDLYLSIAGFLFGLYVFFDSRKNADQTKDWGILGAFVLFIIMELLSVIFNIRGAYNFSKILMVNGYFTLFIAYSLLTAFSLFKDVLTISKHLGKNEERTHEVKEEGVKLSLLVYIVMGIAWYFLISRNTYSFQNFIAPFSEFYFKKHQIGDFAISIESIVLFLLILFLSGLSARIVSFLSTDNKTNGAEERKSGLGSYLLLIRIAIITAGTLLAFVFVGIPMDKMALMISALSVGIGFGLQNLINNLVSGLIIAFEKPINLDDIVEVGGQTGKMKSIGIRSSVITTWDGADVIIPNGDLLSQHLVNWTKGSNKRRYEIELGVAYGSNLNAVKSILAAVLMEHPLVLKNPSPMVWVTKFNDSSIDFAIKYWVPHFNFGNDIRHDLIIAIDMAFKANGIEIPFPQHDVHIMKDEKRIEKNE